MLDAVGNIIESLSQVTQGVDQKLERLQSASTLISTVSGKLSQNVNDQGLILLLLPEEAEQDLVSLTSTIKESAGTMRDVLSAGVNIYRTIDEMPLINLPAPSQEQIDNFQGSVNEIQSAVDNVRTEVAAFRSGISGRITNVQTGANALTSRGGQARDRMSALYARTDFPVKVLDVYPDGRAYNLDESIQRMRYREGYDKPLVWMEPGKVYKVTLQPLTTSNYFHVGHRLRVEVSSSKFPRFDRNLNTGGNNYDEATGVVAHNVVHHSTQHPSRITVTVVKRKAERTDR